MAPGAAEVASRDKEGARDVLVVVQERELFKTGEVHAEILIPWTRKGVPGGTPASAMVELTGLEPATSSMRTTRSPN